MAKYRVSNIDNYLIDALTLTEGETIYVKTNRNVSVADMQAALNAQFGRGMYKASSHGSARYVSRPHHGWWDGETEINSCEEPSRKQY